MSKFSIIIIVSLFFNIGYAQTQEGAIHIESSQEIKDLIAKKITYNTATISSNNYRIQLFYGSENSAIKVQNNFRALFPNTSCSLEYDSPNWKVKVGHYKTRLKADKHLQEVILEFGDAIVLEPKR